VTLRRPALLLAALGVLLLGLVGGALAVYAQIGRAPGEIIEYAQRRLHGHDRLESVALPALETVRQWLGEPGPAERATPFQVPLLTPNPAVARPAAAGVLADAATPAGAKLIRVGPGRAVTSIAVAAKLAVDGSVIEIDPGDYVGDVALWDRAELTLRGMGPKVRLIAAGQHAEGKAIWVVRRGKVTVENIEFIGARVPDRNGAGIRFESGHLVVRGCTFFNNQTGILSTGDPGARLEIENSEFGYNGTGDGRTHGVYAGGIAYLRVSGSYFHHANVGHLIKSRAQVSRIEYNRLTDESGGRASYELEFANGGVAEVVGNIIQQGEETRNSVIVSYGAEGYVWPQNRLSLVHNTVVNDRRFGGTFLRVAPGAEAVLLRNNLFVGSGRVDASGVADEAGDHHVEWEAFIKASRGDYRLAEDARAGLQALPLEGAARGLAPRFTYEHPLRLRALTAGAVYAGALQAP
jgi:hypothetical protein